MKIVFFGTPSFAAETLRALIAAGIEIAAVVTRTDKPKGRSQEPVPTAVKLLQQELIPAVPLYQPIKASSPLFIETLKSIEADLFVVVAYGEIMKEELLELPPLGCINVHASLLPKLRGAAPIQRAIINGERETGVTIMHMAKALDAGDQIYKAEIKIGPEMTAGELHDLLIPIGVEALLKAIHALEKGTAPRIPQNEQEVTWAPKIELEDAEIDWKKGAVELDRLIRGVTPFPGAWCRVEIHGEGKRLKILKARRVQGYSEAPGTLLSYGKEGIIVSTGDEALRLISVKLEGKKEMTAEEFARGYPSIIFLIR